MLVLADTDWDFGDVFLASLVFFFWVLLIWMFIAVFADILRRHDLSGVAKAGWVVLIFVLPLIGILIYLVTRPTISHTGERVGERPPVA